MSAQKVTVIYERRGQAPSPSKDYHQLVVTEELIIFRTWRISLRKEQIGMSPLQNKQTHEDFEYDNLVSSAIRTVFGEDTLLYVQGLVFGDWLVRMKNPILIQILSYLELEDVFRLSRVSRHLRTIFNSNPLWRSIYEMHCFSIPAEIQRLGDEMGWKKMFFTNKLQLRKEVSRLRRFAEEKDQDIEYLAYKLENQHLSNQQPTLQVVQ